MAFNQKTFARQCILLATSGQKAADIAHSLGVQALEHAAAGSNDIRPADMVYKAMIEGKLRAEGFRVWVMTYSPIYWDADGIVKMRPADSKLFVAYNVEAAAANPFWTLKAAQERTMQTLSADALRAMIERYVDRIDKADGEGYIRNADGEIIAKLDGDVGEIKAYAKRVHTAAELADPKSPLAQQFRLIKGQANDLAHAVTENLAEQPAPAIEQVAAA